MKDKKNKKQNKSKQSKMKMPYKEETNEPRQRKESENKIKSLNSNQKVISKESFSQLLNAIFVCCVYQMAGKGRSEIGWIGNEK